jgi:hypothetical protein
LINIVIIVYQGLIEDVQAFRDETRAFRFFEQETGVAWTEFKERCDKEDTETLLGDYAGSNIWEIKIS